MTLSTLPTYARNGRQYVPTAEDLNTIIDAVNAGVGLSGPETSVVDALLLWDSTNATTVKQATSTGQLFAKDGVLRTVAQVINVDAFGADPTGVADSTQAFIDAKASASATNGIVFTGSLGTYKLSKQGAIAHDSLTTGYCVRIADSDAPVAFQFPRGTVFKLADNQAKNTAIVLIDGTSLARRTNPTEFGGVTFDGNYANEASPHSDDHGLVTTLYCDDPFFFRCKFQNYYFAGLHVLRDTRGGKAIACTFDGTHAQTVAGSTAVRWEAHEGEIAYSRFVCDASSGRTHLQCGDNADIQLQMLGIRVTHNVFAGSWAGIGVDLAGVIGCLLAHNVFRDFCNTSAVAVSIGHYTNTNGTVFEAAFNAISDNVFYNVRQCIQITGNATAIGGNNYTIGAYANLIHRNRAVRELTAMRTVLGGADTYPDRFSPAPNAAKVTMAKFIFVASHLKTADAVQPATSASSTTLVNSGGSYGTNTWRYFILVVTDGTGKGQWREIASHTGTTFTVATWDVIPDTTSKFAVVDLIGPNEIASNECYADGTTTVGLDFSAAYLPDFVHDNTVFASNATNAIKYGPLTRYRGNKSYALPTSTSFANGHVQFQDENQGTGTIASGTTSVTITHKLGRTPTVEQIRTILTNNPTNDPGYLYLANVGATTFDVCCRADPGSGGATFAWAAVGNP